jgi:hypothetical protein
VDPLVIAGGVGEGVDLLLGHLDRLGPADVLADQRREAIRTVDGEHPADHGTLLGWQRA